MGNGIVQAYYEKWTREKFEVVQSFKHFGILKYHLCDLDGEDVKGTFCEPELQLLRLFGTRII